MKLTELYAQNPVYAPRIDKDSLFILPQGHSRMTGVFDEAIRFVAENQCKNKYNWILFAEQFKSPVDDNGYAWRCEYWGKMMRGATFTYAYTQDKELYDMMVDTIRDLLSTKDSLGRISTYSVEQEFHGWDIWGRKYVLLGLQYFLDICGDDPIREEIIPVMCENLDYIISKIGRESDGKLPITRTSNFWLGMNSSSILEPVVRLYSITGKKEYLDFASYIVDNGGIDEGNIFELAYEGKPYPYQYPVTKAYEMMSCFEGLMEYYRVTGEEKWKIASINFGKLVAESDITIIGCSGCTHELFDHSYVKQTDTKNFIIMQETCVTVTWMKFITQVLLLSGDAALVDEIEKSAYNALLGSINTEHTNALLGFTFDSYSPLLMATRGRQLGGTQWMRGGKDVYGCCVAIGAAGTALLPSVAVMARKDGLAVNLYEAGITEALTPSGKELTIRTETGYPFDGKIIMSLSLRKPESFAIALRIPQWSAKTSVKVNGKKVTAQNGYTVITREWQKNDVIELVLDMRTRVVAAPGDPADKNSRYHEALVRGPIVLARDARLGEAIDGVVDFALDKDGFAVTREAHTAPFVNKLELAVKQKDGSYIHVVDYASAGKTWRIDSRMTAWMPTKDYWKVDLFKSVTMQLVRAGKYLADEDGTVCLSETSQKWKIEGDGWYVRLMNAKTGRYLAAHKIDDVITPVMVEKADDIGAMWTLTKAVQNRYTIENKLFGQQFFYDNGKKDLHLETPFKEHSVSQTDCWREFTLEN